ncbi:hypothetical protein JQK15_25865 [Sphingobium sp. BHU LFT2]|uniref:hypothetical protein n=1 Tax=Sphingobium sp. BHU LFT2 TaxID=2807634 RepID=UPI001BE5E211|nr:hypothetical protein [Sphingobium sp. BHU LFT2]MBT2246924.1 hypothetical protein [Sphingobium sp. BHU LFT2]
MDESETVASEQALPFDIIPAPITPEANIVETPEAFLTGVSKALKASDDVDAELAEILSDHLLTVTPHANSIVNAKAAILALAAKRATPAQEQADG